MSVNENNNPERPEDEQDIEPTPIEERWAQDTMNGVVIYDSVEDYQKKKEPVRKRSPKIKRKPVVDDKVIRIKNA